MIKNACVGCGSAYGECCCFQGSGTRAKAQEILGAREPRRARILEKEPGFDPGTTREAKPRPPWTAPEKKPDPVNAPAHYTRGGIEVIDAIEAWGLGFRLANVVKYVARAGHKLDRIEDLKKAAWYLEREIRLSESAQLRLAFGPSEDAGEREVCS